MRRPEMAREMTICWISELPSRSCGSWTTARIALYSQVILIRAFAPVWQTVTEQSRAVRQVTEICVSFPRRNSAPPAIARRRVDHATHDFPALPTDMREPAVGFFDLHFASYSHYGDPMG